MNPTRKFETRGVLAGAYRAADPKSFRTHVVELVNGHESRVLCKRVKLENLADPYAADPNAPATCAVCVKRDPRSR